MKVLLLGAGGLLGQAFQRGAAGRQVVAAGRERLDVRRIAELQALVEGAGADVVINCAADTAVDAAEADGDASFAVNSLLPGLVGQACRRNGSVMVQISSTGCYGDTLERPYVEEDALRPTTMHHRSKASGEEAVRQAACPALILRVGWLFGGSPAQAKNFVWRRLLEASGKATILSDPNQVGNPTWVDDVVRQTWRLLDERVLGTFNCVGAGPASRFEYVSAIIGLSGLACRVEPDAGSFARAARVSPNESAENYRLRLMGLDLMAPWRFSLARYMDEVRRWPQWAALQGRPTS